VIQDYIKKCNLLLCTAWKINLADIFYISIKLSSSFTAPCQTWTPHYQYYCVKTDINMYDAFPPGVNALQCSQNCCLDVHFPHQLPLSVSLSLSFLSSPPSSHINFSSIICSKVYTSHVTTSLSHDTHSWTDTAAFHFSYYKFCFIFTITG
jgi:hypothetical protein